MNGKTAKLIRKWVANNITGFQARRKAARKARRMYLATPKPQRHNVKLGMLQELSWHAVRMQGTTNNLT